MAFPSVKYDRKHQTAPVNPLDITPNARKIDYSREAVADRYWCGNAAYRPNLLPSTIWLAGGAVIVAGAL